MEIKTGFGYIKDSSDNIVAKYDLPAGTHPLKEGFSFVEVETRDDLKNISVYVPPKTPDEILEGKIQAEIRSLAVASLTSKGKL